MKREHKSQNSFKNNKKTQQALQTKLVRGAQTLAGGALLDVEELVEAQSILVPSQALLVQLELPQSFVLLVAS